MIFIQKERESKRGRERESEKERKKREKCRKREIQKDMQRERTHLKREKKYYLLICSDQHGRAAKGKRDKNVERKKRKGTLRVQRERREREH